MKNLLLLTALFAFISIPTSNVQAQQNKIDSLYTVPDKLCDGEQVKLGVMLSLKCGASISSEKISTKGNAITVNTDYVTGIICSDSQYSNELDLGVLTSGSYTLTYNLKNAQSTVPETTKTITLDVTKCSTRTDVITSLTQHPKTFCNDEDGFVIVEIDLKCGLTVSGIKKSVNGSTISFDGQLSTGVVCIDRTQSDTLRLGKLAAGQYTVSYNLTIAGTKPSQPQHTKSITIIVCKSDTNQSEVITSLAQYPEPFCDKEEGFVIVDLDLKCGLTVSGVKKSINGNTIDFNGELTTGIACIDRTQTDTLSLGTLAAGQYTINYNLSDINKPNAPQHTKTITITVCLHTGVEDPASKSSLVIANFDNQRFKVDISTSTDDVFQIFVHSMNGQLIKSIKGKDQSYNIDLGNNPSGLYLINVLTDKGLLIGSEKIVVR